MPARLKCIAIKSFPAIAACVCLLSSSARGALLNPGSGPIVTAGAATFAGLTPIADETNPFVGTDAFNAVKFSGTLESTVLREPGGTLDFAYRAVAAVGGPDTIETVSVNSYTGFTTDADYVAGTGSVPFSNANRLAFAAGDTISFAYQGASGIAPGLSTDWILVKTNATNFDNFGTTNFIDGGSGTVISFEPAVAVPEPMSMTLMLAIGGSFQLLRRTRRSV